MDSDARYAQIGSGASPNESSYTRNESDFFHKLDVYDKTHIDGMHCRKADTYSKTELYTFSQVDTLFVSNTSRLNTLKIDVDASKTAIANLTSQDAVLSEFNTVKSIVHSEQTAIANLVVQDAPGS